MKHKSIVFLLTSFFLFSSCASNVVEQTTTVTEVTDNVGSMLQETSSEISEETTDVDNVEMTDADIEEFVTEESLILNEEDTELGLANVKINDDTDLSEEQKLVLQYFDEDYLLINDYEFMKRYPQIFEGAQIKTTGTVKKVLESTDTDYKILLWIGKSEDEFGYRNFDYESYDYAEYVADTSNNLVVVQGQHSNVRLIEGDRIEVYGRYLSLDNYEIDGVSSVLPTIDSYIAYIHVGGFDLGGIKFDADYIRKVAKAIFGDDVTIRNSVNGEDYVDNMFYYDRDPFMIVEPDNQTNSKFTEFRFYMTDGYIEDAKAASRNVMIETTNSAIIRSIEFAPDFEHFYLFILDPELRVLTVEYYSKDFEKIWRREFENTEEAVYDYTSTNVYLVADNDLYIIDVATGDDRYEPNFIGSKTNVRKFSDGILFFDSNSTSDAIMKTDLTGNIIWKTDVTDYLYYQEIQLINNKYVIGAHMYEDHYIVLDAATGSMEIDAVALQ